MVPLRCSGRPSATPRTSARGERRREGAAAWPARPFVTKSGGRKSVDPPNGRCDAASSGKARRRRRRPLVLAVRAGAPAHFLGESHRLKLSSSASPPPPFGGLRLPPPLASAGRRRAQVWTRPLGKKKRPRTVLQGRSQTSPFLLATGWTPPRRRNLSFPTSLRRPGVGRPRGGGGI